MSGTEMPALLLTETTCVSQAAGQRSRQAWDWGLGGGEMQAGPHVCPGMAGGREVRGHLHVYKSVRDA